MELITLDKAVVNALEYFAKHPPAKINPLSFSFPFVIGSGNAYNTGLILFGNIPSVIVDESKYKQAFTAYKQLIDKKIIQDAVVISASGEKDSVAEIENAKQIGLTTTLYTCSKNSTGAKRADHVYVFDKLPEPYTYNTSTYMGMMLGASDQKPQEILDYIQSVRIPNMKQYESYSFVVPDEFVNICAMLDIKESELFGSQMSIRAFSFGHARHAKFVIPSDKELVIVLGEGGECFGKKEHRVNLPIPKNTQYPFVMALTYYLIGKIQEIKPPLFKQNIRNYCLDYGPKAYGSSKPFEVIVPGSV